jgi:hypothetical protein
VDGWSPKSIWTLWKSGNILHFPENETQIFDLGLVSVPSELFRLIKNYLHNSVLYIIHNVSETGFCLRLQVKPSVNIPSSQTYKGEPR